MAKSAKASEPLKRLNYFDGRFLRAAHLDAEQRYVRRLVQLANQPGGAGVVHGLELSFVPGGPGAGAQGALRLSAGLAIDDLGRTLWLPAPIERELGPLLAPLRDAGQGDGALVTQPPEAFEIAIAWSEEPEGDEEVFGQTCPDACARTTQRAFW